MIVNRFIDFIRPFVKWILLAVSVIILLAILVRLLGIRPPDEFTFATGRQGGAYYEFATIYQERFAEEGYRLNIVETAGSVETVDLLNRGVVDAGFVQSNVNPATVSPDLGTLASVYYEALWVFFRDDIGFTPTSLRELSGLRINIGEPLSGTQTAASVLLTANGVTAENTTIMNLPTTEAIEELLIGNLDVVMIVSGAASPSVQQLARTPGIELLSLEDTKAYTSRYKNAAALSLGAGSFDLANNIPSEDKNLIAGTAMLVANEQLHPDLARLLLVIAADVHKRGGLLEQSGEFPSTKLVGIPMNPDAERYLENGPTGLERYLPLWMASRLERLLFLLLPAVLILYPLLQSTPKAVGYYNQYRIKRHYQRLRKIEQEYGTYNRLETAEAITELESMQTELTDKMSVPTTFLDEFYTLRMHINLVLERLYERNLKAATESEADA